MNDTERDARIAECINNLNNARIRENWGDIWFYVSKLCEVMQVPIMTGRPIDDSIPERVYSEPLQSWMEAVRRQVKANAQSAQDSKNLAEQACARTEAAVYCLAEYSDSAGQPQRCRMDKGHVGGHTQNPATTKHRR